MRWIRAEHYDDMCERAASRIFTEVSTAAETGRPCGLGLATGNTMIGVYRRLARKLNDARTPLDRLTTFNLDEYVGADGRNVGSDHPLSYRTYMNTMLFSLLDPALEFDTARAFFPDAADPARYDGRISGAGGIDLQLLGIGFNGHIAFNEPAGADTADADDFARSPSRTISLDALTITTNARLTAGGDINAMPVQAVTMGMASILAARAVILLACFPEQAAPLNAIIANGVTPENPASFLLGHRACDIVYTADRIVLTGV
ncbi:MAG: glucosamine-6-phosphate deaminase [Spirochaetes bacterium]|nr:glucosamine-6-phosphate deaminase [Spirochaetota bacterium]